MLRLVRLWQEIISSSSISVSTLACLRYGIKMHGRTPKEILCRLSLISSHNSSSPISPRSGPSGTHSSAILSVSDRETIACCWGDGHSRSNRSEHTPWAAKTLVTHSFLEYRTVDWLEEAEKHYKKAKLFPRPVGVCVKACVCVYVWACGQTCKTRPLLRQSNKVLVRQACWRKQGWNTGFYTQPHFRHTLSLSHIPLLFTLLFAFNRDEWSPATASGVNEPTCQHGKIWWHESSP